MPALPVVEHLDLVGHIAPRFLVRAIDPVDAQLTFAIRSWRRCRPLRARRTPDGVSRITGGAFFHEVARHVRCRRQVTVQLPVMLYVIFNP